MRILAIETSEKIGSLAALDAGRLVSQADLPAGRRTAAEIGPSVVALLAEADWRPADVQLLAVTTGPGSFTGLRIGVTFAKCFAYATGAEVIGCDTLETIALAVPTTEQTLWVVTDAQRQQIFARPFVAKNSVAENGGDWIPEQATEIMDNAFWLEELSGNLLVSGGALERLQEKLPQGVEVTNAENWRPTASHLGRLAWRDYQSGRRDDLWKLAPKYYRLSYAEEKEARLPTK